MNTREAQGLDEDTMTANWEQACYQSFEEALEELDYDSCRITIQDAESKHLDDLVARMNMKLSEVQKDDNING